MNVWTSPKSPAYASPNPLALLALALTATWAAQTSDWPQYRGLHYTGVTEEEVARWGDNGPKVLWKVPARDGFSSFSIAAGKALTIMKRQVDGADQEVCVAFDAESGKELWAASIGVAKYDGGGDDGASDNKGGDGPRNTPTLSGGKVYVSTPALVVHCLDLNSGKSIWTRDIMKEHAGRNIGWKNAASPVVDGDLVFVAGGGAGQSLLALNAQDGSVVWKGEDEMMTHASPVPTTILGQRQVVFFAQSGLVSVSAKDGKVLWRYAFPYKVSTAASPVVCGDIVYCAAGYGVGSGAAKITKEGDGFKATEIWRLTNNKPVANHWSTPVFKDGYLYGMFSFKEYAKGPMKCVEVATGKVMWEKEGFGAGNVILAKDTIVALGDAGQVVLVEANPKAYTELARAKVVDGKCWSTPSLSNGRLYVRSTKEAACLDVR